MHTEGSHNGADPGAAAIKAGPPQLLGNQQGKPGMPSGVCRPRLAPCGCRATTGRCACFRRQGGWVDGWQGGTRQRLGTWGLAAAEWHNKDWR